MTPKISEVTRVLVVDAVQETGKLIELILRKSGQCAVTNTDHPSKALPFVVSGGIDLVLCEAFNDSDASLDFCRQLKADPEIQHVPVILYSTVHDRQSMLRGFDAGAVDYLFKPLFPMELAARVRTHFQLKRQKDLTMRKVVEQRELIHIMCHDLTGPVGASLSLLEFGREDPGIMADCMDSIIGSLKKAMELTNLVRQLQAVEDGKKEWVLEPLDVKDAFSDAASVFKERMEQKGITIADTVEPGIKVLVERVSFVNSVIANLLSNAIKFSMENSVISFTARREGQKVILTVADSGIGMPRSISDNLFNLSVPTSREGTKNEQGTGYGMPLVKKFVQSYQGELNVYSKDIKDSPEDHGTRVEIVLDAG